MDQGDWSHQILQRMNQLLDEMKDLTAQLARQRMLDEVTGLYNREYLGLRLREEIALAHRKGQFLSLILFELDDVSQFESKLGEPEARALLRELGQRLLLRRRQSDAYFRFGEWGFVGILPATPPAGAAVSAERIRRVVCNRPFLDGKVTLTASFGLATYPLHATDEHELLAAAARACQAAREQGRNQIQQGETIAADSSPGSA